MSIWMILAIGLAVSMIGEHLRRKRPHETKEYSDDILPNKQ